MAVVPGTVPDLHSFHTCSVLDLRGYDVYVTSETRTNEQNLIVKVISARPRESTLIMVHIL